MQNTLRYMTKLDRAINNEDKLSELDNLYNTHNITPVDLFNILNRVKTIMLMINYSKLRQ